MDIATPRVTLDDIEAAATRISGRVRRTPCIRSRFNLAPLGAGELLLKLECLQVTGSFKARGANNAILSLDEASVKRGVISASGGNHGLAVAYAGRASETSALIYLPEATPAAKADKLRDWGAEVVIEGAVWDDANRAALSRAERDGLRAGGSGRAERPSARCRPGSREPTGHSPEAAGERVASAARPRAVCPGSRPPGNTRAAP